MSERKDESDSEHEAVGSSARPSLPVAALSGRRLLIARVAWVSVTVLTLGLDAAGIPYAYARYETVCAGASCLSPLTPYRLRALHEMGLSAGFFATCILAILIGATLVYCVVAALIFLRGPNDRMALYASFTLLVFGTTAFARDLPQSLAAAHPVLWLPVYSLYYVGQVCLVVFFYLFPDGRFVPRWTRWLAAVAALLFVPYAFFPDSSLNLLNGPLFLILIGTTVVAQVYRYRRASNAMQRRQTRWVVFGVATAITGFSTVIVLLNVYSSLKQSGPLVVVFVIALIQGSITLIPLSIGVAIVRSRLYDIDVLINRALVYGSLTAMLVTLYFGGIVFLQRVFVLLTGQESTLAVVASTLLIAALFNPLRGRVQALVDRRFYRRKYDAAKTLEAFSARLREETDLDTLVDDLEGVVGETMRPAHVSLWLRPETASEAKRPD